MQQITAHRCIGQPCDNAHLILFFRQTIAEFAHAQKIIQIFGRNGYGVHFAFDDFCHGLTSNFRNLAFKVTHTRLARVVLDHRGQGAIGQLKFTFFQAVVFHRLINQVTPRDFAFFVLGIPRQWNDLHAVQ